MFDRKMYLTREKEKSLCLGYGLQLAVRQKLPELEFMLQKLLDDETVRIANCASLVDVGYGDIRFNCFALFELEDGRIVDLEPADNYGRRFRMMVPDRVEMLSNMDDRSRYIYADAKFTFQARPDNLLILLFRDDVLRMDTGWCFIDDRYETLEKSKFPTNVLYVNGSHPLPREIKKTVLDLYCEEEDSFQTQEIKRLFLATKESPETHLSRLTVFMDDVSLDINGKTATSILTHFQKSIRYCLDRGLITRRGANYILAGDEEDDGQGDALPKRPIASA